MRIHATNCPYCGTNVTLVVDRFGRCEGQCGACDRIIMTSLPRVAERPIILNDCAICGSQPLATTFVDHCKRRYCAITCLTCGTTLASSRGDVVDKWTVMTMRRADMTCEKTDNAEEGSE